MGESVRLKLMLDTWDSMVVLAMLVLVMLALAMAATLEDTKAITLESVRLKLMLDTWDSMVVLDMLVLAIVVPSLVDTEVTTTVKLMAFCNKVKLDNHWRNKSL